MCEKHKKIGFFVNVQWSPAECGHFTMFSVHIDANFGVEEIQLAFCARGFSQ